MDSFLKSLAKAYTTQYHHALSEVCFVFPSKRSGTFFTRSLHECLGNKIKLMPQVTTIADLVENLSGRIIDSRIDQVCLLYDIYRQMQTEQKVREVTFDKFSTWADTILQDFNDVEMYRVNPKALFRNVKLLKNINSNYLTEEQIKVMRQYFGYSDFYSPDAHLWQHYSGEKPIRKRFMSLFDALGILFEQFCTRLEERGLTFNGKAYAQALETLEKDPQGALPYQRIVFAGFNALTTVEFMIFKTLAKTSVTLPDGELQPLADFYWDCTGVPLGFQNNIGNHFIAQNRRHFHSLYDLSDADCSTLPDKIDVISSPSGVAQAKIAGRLIDNILNHKSESGTPFNDTEVAVVLPDENLLLPVLHSLPQTVSSLNLTMGYTFSQTTVATFVLLLERYQKNLRLLNNNWKARTSDVDAILGSPMTTLIIGRDRCTKLSRELLIKRRTSTPVSFLTEKSDDCRLIFSPLGRKATSADAVNYLRKVLLELDQRLGKDVSTDSSNLKLDHAHTMIYLEALQMLESAFIKYRIRPGAATTFKMITRLLASETVRFEGKPLQGIQVMGPLETRCLDFKYIIIPSMNERIYPRRLNTRSFIPAVVRHGFGMATTRFQESIFTYYFYRMISRAKEVYLIYDSRTEGLHSGSPSRFILQLQHLYALDKIKYHRYRFNLSNRQRNEVQVAKTPEIMTIIDKFFTPGLKKCLSASSLNTYINCPLKFYLQTVRGVSRDISPIDGLQAADQGNIIHESLKTLYLSLGEKLPVTITQEKLIKLSNDDATIRNAVVAAINTTYYNDNNPQREVENDIEIFVPHLCDTIRSVIRFDAAYAADSSFQLLAAEQRLKQRLCLPSGNEVNFNYIIDRVDQRCGDASVRVVDYKTGKYDIKAKNLTSLFEEGNAGEALQLFLYSILLRQRFNNKFDISCVIYDITEIGSDKNKLCVNTPTITDKGKFEKISSVEADFMQLLEHKLNELRRSDLPFKQAPEGSAECRYCPFAQTICGIAVH